jgi:hypothetical protein
MTDADGKAGLARPRWLFPLLIVYTIAGVLLLAPASLMALMSPMLSDSGINFFVWALILGLALAPVVLLASLVTAWLSYAMTRYRITALAMCVPLVWLALTALAFVAVDYWPLHQ